MTKKIKIYDQEIAYRLKKSRRAKRMRLAVYCNAEVVITLPYWASENLAEKFIKEKANWLFNKVAYFKNRQNFPLIKRSRSDYLKNRNSALELIKQRVEHFNKIYNFNFNNISVRNQKTRWGSCSKKGNLNYSYKILFLPEKIRDYIIVHELCHLGEFNHSRKFWSLLAEVLPDYAAIRRELKGKDLSSI